MSSMRITSCTNVLNKYVKALQSGALNPETGPVSLTRSSGMLILIRLSRIKQSKLDAWMAENK